MLVTLNDVLHLAKKQNYAVDAFNVYNLETAQAVVEAAEAERSPAIMGTTEKAISYAGLDNLANLLIGMAKKSSVPLVVHLDHGKNIKMIQSCIEIGYSSVMIDVSSISEEEKIKMTKFVVDEAHRKNITVEGERDFISRREEYIKGHTGEFTDPEVADEFIKETGVDAFAVSIGNIHGKPLPNEKINIELLQILKEKIKVPLVLHGASGMPTDQLEEVIKCGITKINIDTELRLAFMSTAQKTLTEKPDISDPRIFLSEIRHAMVEVIKAQMRLCGSSGRANGQI